MAVHRVVMILQFLETVDSHMAAYVPAALNPSGIFVVLIYVRGRVNPRAVMLLH